jgi:PKD domain
VTGTLLRVSIAAAAAALFVVPDAQAATYCVGTASCPGGTKLATFQQALSSAAAATNADTILLGPGTFSGPFNYLSAGAVTVQGAGRGSTVLTMPAGQPDFEEVLRLGDSGGAKRVSDLAVRLPVEARVSGITIAGAAGSVIERVSASGPGTADQRSGLLMSGVANGVVRNSSAIMSLTDNPSEALNLTGGTTTVEDVALTGGNGIFASDGGVTVRRTHIRARYFGYQAQSTGNLLESTTIDLAANGLAGVFLTTFMGNAGLTARHVTIVGDSTGIGAYVTASAGDNATLTLSNSIIHGPQIALSRAADGAGSVATLTPQHSSYDSANNASSNTNGGTGSIVAPVGLLPPSPGFVDEAGRDLRLRYDSPLIDAGSGSIFLASPFDFDGLSRVVAGKGGAAVRDPGAYEYQRRPPVAKASISPAAGPAGRAFSFSAAGSADPDHGDPLAYAWSFEDGTTASGPSVGHLFARAVRHHATLTVIDPTGLRSTATVEIADAVAPSIERSRMLRKRFRVARKATPRVAGRIRAGSAFLFSLSEPARVAIAIERALPVRRRRGRCVSPKRARRGGHRCTRYKRAGTLERTLHAGKTKVGFGGRIGRKALRAGRYRATVRATDPSGNRSARRRLSFRVLDG